MIRKAVDKYDDCCKLEIAVNNTEVFVEKIIENEKICGLRMKAWQRIAGMVKYGIALLGIFSAVLFIFLAGIFSLEWMCSRTILQFHEQISSLHKIKAVGKHYAVYGHFPPFQGKNGKQQTRSRIRCQP